MFVPAAEPENLIGRVADTLTLSKPTS